MQANAPLPSSLGYSIRQRIRQEGAISVADFMAEALGADVHGYYMARQPFGAGGDFVTAPEISQLFGEMLGVWCAFTWKQLGCPSPFALVELGPGRGTLMQDMLRATRNAPGFHQALSVHLVEMSPSLRSVQQQALAEITGSHAIPLSWHRYVQDMPAMPHIIIANEFFDALPIQQYVKRTEREVSLWLERKISISDESEELFFTLTPATAAAQSFLDAENPFAKSGDMVEVSPESLAIIRHLAERMNTHLGAALLIDYGYDYDPQNRTLYGDTLQAVKNHRYHPVLDNPGEADITSHVDFAALKQAAAVRGIRSFGAITQQELLTRLGIALRADQLMAQATAAQRETLMYGMQRLVSPDQMGTLFKAIALASPTLNLMAGFS